MIEKFRFVGLLGVWIAQPCRDSLIFQRRSNVCSYKLPNCSSTAEGPSRQRSPTEARVTLIIGQKDRCEKPIGPQLQHWLPVSARRAKHLVDAAQIAINPTSPTNLRS